MTDSNNTPAPLYEGRHTQLPYALGKIGLPIVPIDARYRREAVRGDGILGDDVDGGGVTALLTVLCEA